MSPRFLVFLLVQCCLLVGCGSAPPERRADLKPNQYEVFGQVYEVLDSNLGYLEIGIASWYGKKFHGRLTANGEVYDMFELSAAHKSLPLPTTVRVTNLDNGRDVVLRVNDRGPFHDDRVIDLSWAAARALGFEDKGTAPVVVEALDEINHPELTRRPAHVETYYLQVGAFQSEQGANWLLTALLDVIPGDAPARILMSETETAILHKVWVGPIASFDEEERIAALIREKGLGNPIRVRVQ